LLQAHRFQPTGMGPRTLRTDTACIALLAIARSSRESSGFRVQISD
jgi:16S rRNA U1498 N3-methylase RsmE